MALRLSRDLARALARWARDHGVAKSEVVREAVATYLAPASARAESSPAVTAAGLAARWPALVRLSLEETRALARDLAAARRELPPAQAPWE